MSKDSRRRRKEKPDPVWEFFLGIALLPFSLAYTLFGRLLGRKRQGP